MKIRYLHLVLFSILVLTAVPALGQGTLFVENDMVGIGVSTPTRPLHVVTTGAPANTVLEVENDFSARIRFRNSASGETWNFGHQVPSGTGLVFSDVGDAFSEMLLDVDGNLEITGTLTTQAGPWPDFVFADDYQLLPLQELRDFIDTHGHLPGVQSQEQMEARGGVNMSELQVTLLQKVEELTLYTLEQDDLIAEQKRQLDALADQTREQQELLAELKAQLGARDGQDD